MIFNVWTFLFQVVNFLVLVAIMRWLLYRPLREAIDRRREANARAQADAEAARQEAAALQASLDQQLADLEPRREAVIREARERAEAERQALLAEAEGTIGRRREAVEQQFARERDEALRALRADRADRRRQARDHHADDRENQGRAHDRASSGLEWERTAALR